VGEESHKTMSQLICTKFGEFIDHPEVVTIAKFGSKIFIGFSGPSGGKKYFPFRKPTAYVTLPRATEVACDIGQRMSNMSNSTRFLLECRRSYAVQ